MNSSLQLLLHNPNSHRAMAWFEKKKGQQKKPDKEKDPNVNLFPFKRDIQGQESPALSEMPVVKKEK